MRHQASRLAIHVLPTPVILGKLRSGPLPDPGDAVTLRFGLDVFHDEIERPGHLRPQTLRLWRRGIELAPQLLVEGFRSLVGILDEVNAELDEVPRRPQPFVAEQRPAVEQATLLPPLGGVEDGGRLLPAHHVSLLQKRKPKGANTRPSNDECARTSASWLSRGLEDPRNGIARGVDRRPAGRQRTQRPAHPKMSSTARSSPATAPAAMRSPQRSTRSRAYPSGPGPV